MTNVHTLAGHVRQLWAIVGDNRPCPLPFELGAGVGS
jgi:hypothetical protein